MYIWLAHTVNKLNQLFYPYLKYNTVDINYYVIFYSNDGSKLKLLMNLSAKKPTDMSWTHTSRINKDGSRAHHFMRTIGAILISPTDKRRPVVVNLLFLPLMMIVYFLNFLSPISKLSVLSSATTILCVTLLSIHRVLAVLSLLTFRKAKQFTSLAKRTRLSLDIWTGQHLLSFIIEQFIFWDYWYPSHPPYQYFELAVYTTVCLISTVVFNTLYLLIASVDVIISPENRVFSFLNLHKLFYIPILWLAVFMIYKDSIFNFEVSRSHCFVLMTLIWYPAAIL